MLTIPLLLGIPDSSRHILHLKHQTVQPCLFHMLVGVEINTLKGQEKINILRIEELSNV